MDNPFLKNLRQILLFATAIIIAVSCLKFFIWTSYQQEITTNFGLANKYWYTPLATNIDVFLCGFLINPLLMSIRPKVSLRQQKLMKLASIILLVILYFVSAYHVYHEELWGAANRSFGWLDKETIFLFQPLTALLTSFFILAFELQLDKHGNNEKLLPSSIKNNPVRSLEIIGNLSFGIYVWHYPIINKLSSLYSSEIPWKIYCFKLVVAVTFSTILAVTTYYLVEVPFAQRKVYKTNL